MQHDHHCGPEVGVSGGVWEDTEEVRERGVVNFDTGMGISDSAEEGRTPEIGQKRYWSKAKRQGRQT